MLPFFTVRHAWMVLVMWIVQIWHLISVTPLTSVDPCVNRVQNASILISVRESSSLAFSWRLMCDRTLFASLHVCACGNWRFLRRQFRIPTYIIRQLVTVFQFTFPVLSLYSLNCFRIRSHVQIMTISRRIMMVFSSVRLSFLLHRWSCWDKVELSFGQCLQKVGQHASRENEDSSVIADCLGHIWITGNGSLEI